MSSMGMQPDTWLMDIIVERVRKSDKKEFPKELLKCEICDCHVPVLYALNGSVRAYCSKHIDHAPVGSAVYSSEKYGYIVALIGDGKTVLIMNFDRVVGKWC